MEILTHVVVECRTFWHVGHVLFPIRRFFDVLLSPIQWAYKIYKEHPVDFCSSRFALTYSSIFKYSSWVKVKGTWLTAGCGASSTTSKGLWATKDATCRGHSEPVEISYSCGTTKRDRSLCSNINNGKPWSSSISSMHIHHPESHQRWRILQHHSHHL